MIFGFTAYGCQYDNLEETIDKELMGTAPCSGISEVSFTSNVLPIFEQNCNDSGCHDAQSRADGIDLTSYQQTEAAGFLRVLASMEHSQGFSPMPKRASKLDDCTLQVIHIWISEGSKDN